MAEQIFKTDFGTNLKQALKYQTNDDDFWCKNLGYLQQRRIKNSRHFVNFYMIDSQNKYSDSQTDKL